MKEQLKIAVLAPYRIYPALSGGQRCTALLYKYLSESLPVMMLSVDSNSAPEKSNVVLKKIMGNSFLRYANPFLFFRALRFIKANACTHLVLEHPYFGWLGWMLRRSCNVQLVVHSHNIEGLRFRSMGKWWWRILRSYERWTHQQADINFFITQEDLDHARSDFKLEKENCHVITYGTDLQKIPQKEQRISARKQIAATHRITKNETIILFNGVLDYRPNLDAVDTILKKINPVLDARNDFDYRIIICGKNLPDSYDELKAYHEKNIIYPGFVEDISLYFLAADIFINPVKDGGGIKTKLVEALGFNVPAISTESGAAGVPLSITGNSLTVLADDNDAAFCDAIFKGRSVATNIPDAFFGHFYWGNIARKAGEILEHSLTNRR
ncbi:MAG: glycosyltransferase family 4 protein [Ferruginibacter sp.]